MPQFLENLLGKRRIIFVNFLRDVIGEQPAMINVVLSLYTLRRHFGDKLICLETGTIRSYEEKHWSTYHIAKAIGENSVLHSVDSALESIEVSKKICKGLTNIEYHHCDSIEFLKTFKYNILHFVLLDSANDPDHIFEEFQLVIPKVCRGGFIIVDDAGISIDGKTMDKSIAAQKGHRIWQHLVDHNYEFEILLAPRSHGTQLRYRKT